MAYRGRLIWPFLAEIARLDTASTFAAPGAGAVSGGYDPDFREPVLVDQGPDSVDTPTRREILVLGLPCQVHSEKGPFDALRQMNSGGVREYALRLIFHYTDLESRSLVRADGASLLTVNDRLASIRTIGGELVASFTERPIFVTEAQDRSFGLSGLRRNLLMLTFQERETGSLTS